MVRKTTKKKVFSHPKHHGFHPIHLQGGDSPHLEETNPLLKAVKDLSKQQHPYHPLIHIVKS